MSLTHSGRDAQTSSRPRTNHLVDEDDDRLVEPPRLRDRSTIIHVPGEDAEELTLRRLAVVPMTPRTKKPYVRWKGFQTTPPTDQQVRDWWAQWPDAGIGLVLGPVSRVLAIDVDGPEAHAELLRHLGHEPLAPKMWSGSGKPYRYQLFFHHPEELTTKAKFTPWHPQLEFRGQGGLSILPPSLHKSGLRYRWASGRSLTEMELPPLPPPMLAALRDTHPKPAGNTPLVTTAIAPAELDRVQRRALALITSKVHAVEGDGGDKATFTAACYLVREFGLSVEQALPVFRTWNGTNCSPPWSEEGLLYKLRKAADWEGVRGRLITAAVLGGGAVAPSPATRSVADESFAVPVPDWTLGDWMLLQPRPTRASRGRPSSWRKAVNNLVFAARVAQRSSVVRLPDVALAQLAWGERVNWPRRWRTHLHRRLRRLPKPRLVTMLSTEESGGCRQGCPLHHVLDCPHRDIRFRLKGWAANTRLELFAVEQIEKLITYDFTGNKSHHPDQETAKKNTKQILAAKKEGRLCSIYLPAWVFGPLALPDGPCRILKSLTRELTRQRGGTSRRPDRAEEVSHSTCPLLDAGRMFVAFDGNGSRRRPHFHGRGYSLGQRMGRAGYPHDPTIGSFRAVVKQYLSDLRALSEPFGLVVAARIPGRDGLATLDELIADVDLVRPKLLASKCLIRVYTAADFLDRWRTWFAASLGFKGIPRDAADETPAPTPTSDNTIHTAEQLARWMRDGGWNDAGLAAAVRMSRVQVCRYRTGSRRISDAFRAKLASLPSSARPTGRAVPKGGRK